MVHAYAPKPLLGPTHSIPPRQLRTQPAFRVAGAVARVLIPAPDRILPLSL